MLLLIFEQPSCFGCFYYKRGMDSGNVTNLVKKLLLLMMLIIFEPSSRFGGFYDKRGMMSGNVTIFLRGQVRLFEERFP